MFPLMHISRKLEIPGTSSSRSFIVAAIWNREEDSEGTLFDAVKGAPMRVVEAMVESESAQEVRKALDREITLDLEDDAEEEKEGWRFEEEQDWREGKLEVLRKGCCWTKGERQ